jgi:hypothetical protein
MEGFEGLKVTSISSHGWRLFLCLAYSQIKKRQTEHIEVRRMKKHQTKQKFIFNKIYICCTVFHFFLIGKVFSELSRVLHWTELSFTLALSLLSLAARHLWHHAWLTMHNCEIYNSSAVNYEPETTYLIFIRVNNIYQGPGERGLQLIS